MPGRCVSSVYSRGQWVLGMGAQIKQDLGFMGV
jgi:hypothetical protein